MHVGKTIESMVQQTLLPLQWVIVDDGSTDSTGEIVRTASRNHTWVTAVRRRDRGHRQSGGGVVEAFEDGYTALREKEWDFIVKLDGDLSFAPDYFESCFKHFIDDARLGIGGGTVHIVDHGQLKIDSPGDPPFHVRGATKIYRRACWEQIRPLVRAPGWDTVDEVKANMHGWRTRTFPGVGIVQQRATGAAYGEWPNWFKNGLANYVTGYHPLFMVAKCLKRAWGKPSFIAPAALLTGFCSGYLRRLPRIEDATTVRYLRQQQMRRLLMRSSIYGKPW